VPDPMLELETALLLQLGAGSSEVSTDPILAAAAPGGVHSRSADTDDYPFIVIGLVFQDDDHTYTRAWRHRFRYGISATDDTASIDRSAAALQRVYELLQDADLPMEHFTLGFLRRTRRTGITPSASGVVYQRVTDDYLMEVYPHD
jgi:hypothetical protein